MLMSSPIGLRNESSQIINHLIVRNRSNIINYFRLPLQLHPLAHSQQVKLRPSGSSIHVSATIKNAFSELSCLYMMQIGWDIYTKEGVISSNFVTFGNLLYWSKSKT
ncbi:hypothetical protein SSX86_007123 [Deinandra increscens subsp. villosa]|uniref:Uncharacterized protein n=1 Tax=Deinandra increscens subsp. villosa TaxID=3103831 RepID=A0AAP0DK13_9ASTR